MRYVLLTLLCALLCGCSTPPVQPSPEPFFRDHLFVASAQRADAEQVFALSDAMRHYLRVEIAQQLRHDGPAQGLINALYRRDQLKLDYDSAATRNAAQAFDARKGNCLSLVLMTAAFAKELGLQVTYQSVASEETWTHSQGIAFLSTHINVTLGPRATTARSGFDGGPRLTVDFLPAEDLRGQRIQPVSEDTVVAMYMNNRAAESLARGLVDEAYWWARAAIVQAPQLRTAYNTLGVVYMHHADMNAAEQVFASLLRQDPHDKQALANLATMLDTVGRFGESAAARAVLARLEPYPPFHFFRLGTAAMEQGDFKNAKRMFAKEVDRAEYSSEFHFWLALANFRLGDADEARKEMQLAVKNSTSRGDHDLYAAKLERLRSETQH